METVYAVVVNYHGCANKNEAPVQIMYEDDESAEGYAELIAHTVASTMNAQAADDTEYHLVKEASVWSIYPIVNGAAADDVASVSVCPFLLHRTQQSNILPPKPEEVWPFEQIGEPRSF